MASINVDVDVDVDIVDYIDELETSELIAELKHRGEIPEEQVVLDPRTLDGMKLRDHLALIVGCGSWVQIEEILIKLKDKYEN